MLHNAYYITTTCTSTIDHLIDRGNLSREGGGGSMRPYRQNSMMCIKSFYCIALAKKAQSDNSLMADEWWGLLISSGFHHKHLGTYWQLWTFFSTLFGPTHLGSEQALAPCRCTGILRRRGLPQSPWKSEVIKSFVATSNHHRFLSLRGQI
jgi:hypothetical protein